MKDDLRAQQASVDTAKTSASPPRVEPRLYGAIEGGGTKFAYAVGRSATEVHESVVLPTSDPEATLGACVDFFAAAERKFGPIGATGRARIPSRERSRGDVLIGTFRRVDDSHGHEAPSCDWATDHWNWISEFFPILGRRKS